VNLKGTVPTSAPYGAKQLLDVIDVAINSLQPGLDDDGVHVVAYVGDASGNAQYTTLDVLRLERVAMGLDGGCSAYRNVDPRLIADLNGDGAVSLTDRDILNQEVQFLANPATGANRSEIPAIPAGIGPIQFSGPDPLVALPDDLTALRGETLTVPVYLDTAENLESVQLTLGYDANALEVLAVRPGSLTQQFPYFIERHDGGTVYVDMSGPRLAGGAGTLVELVVRIEDTASGPLAIDFQSAALNEGHLTIGVLPVAGSDPTDGRIVVAQSGGGEVSTNADTASTFFEAFKAKLDAAAWRVASFFEQQEEAPVAPLTRVAVESKNKQVAAPAIDLTGRLASFAVSGSDVVMSQLNDGQRWKRDLAGSSAGTSADPNSKLRIPVSVTASNPMRPGETG
jgi:hypothetical protein